MFELMDDTTDSATLTVLNVGLEYSEILKKIKQSKIAFGLNFLINNITNSSYNRNIIKERITNSDMLILVCDMKDKNNIELISKITKTAQEIEILTFVIALIPTQFPNGNAINIIRKNFDSLLVIPNYGSDTNKNYDININNNVILQALLGLTEMIYRPGLIRVDFADVRAALSASDIANMGFGSAHGTNRAKEATELALSSEAFKEVDLSTAGGLLVSVRAGINMSIDEFEIVCNVLKALISESCIFVVGTIVAPELQDEIQVIIIYSGRI